MNAICHRTYESNGPIQFYQYNDDRISCDESYMDAQNFPFVNDYQSCDCRSHESIGVLSTVSAGES